MNDTIMASVEAAKSRKQAAQQMRLSGFRSVRNSAGEKVKRVREKSGLTGRMPVVSSLTLTFEEEIIRKLRAQTNDPAGLVQKIVRDHLRNLGK